ncbi:MAG: thioredoxin domain-containing protein, partial [Xanthobacteraceae bacterium]
CATFTKDVFPKLKAAYIDSGKARFVFREFPLDLTAAAGSMLARCIADGDANKYFAAIDLLFRQQDVWAVQNPTAPLKRVARQAGMGEQQFETCLKDQKLLDAIKESQDYAVKTLKINSTPTFFVNDTMVRGETSFEAFQKIIDPLLKG